MTDQSDSGCKTESGRTGVSAAIKRNDIHAAGGPYPYERDDENAHREKVTMDIKKKIEALRSGDLSRRDFNTALSAVGVSLAMMPMVSRKASAAAADQATYFTCLRPDAAQNHRGN